MMLFGILILILGAFIISQFLWIASQHSQTESSSFVQSIDDLLPQTQCGQCGYPGCRPYAEALASGEDHNKCPPGGEDLIQELSLLLHREPLPFDATHGQILEQPKVAFIREDECIGCTKCINACPVDAIVGASQMMHTVIADECTGCDLCLAPCPMDCIEMRDYQE